jgi:cell division protein FtsQ
MSRQHRATWRRGARAKTLPPRTRPVGLASSRSRFAARAAAVRRRPWLLAAWGLAVVAVLAGIFWLVGMSPVLAARTVRVEGVPAAAAADIRRRADVPIGTPLARLDTDAIARRVINSGTLAEVSVVRSWPRTVVIAASLRQPVLAFTNSQGQVQVADKDGVVYATVASPPRGVPVITAAGSTPGRDALRAAISVLDAMTGPQRRDVTDIRVSTANLVTLKLGGVTVVWGGASEPQLKVEVMSVLAKQKGVRLVDVSAPRTPITR